MKILKLSEEFAIKLAVEKSQAVMNMQEALNRVAEMVLKQVGPQKFQQHNLGVIKTGMDGWWGQLTNNALNRFNWLQQKAKSHRPKLFAASEQVTLGKLGPRRLVENPDALAAANTDKINEYIDAANRGIEEARTGKKPADTTKPKSKKEAAIERIKELKAMYDKARTPKEYNYISTELHKLLDDYPGPYIPIVIGFSQNRASVKSTKREDKVRFARKARQWLVYAQSLGEIPASWKGEYDKILKEIDTTIAGF